MFFKYAPLLDPYKYLLGKYDISNPNLFNLPTRQETEQQLVHSKMLDVNNAAYVDGLFVYLSSFLIHNNNFINGVDFYGSFLSIKQKYRINVEDDIEYLMKSPFFNEHKNKLFTVDDYEHLFQDNFDKKEPIKINTSESVNINADADIITDNLFDNVFDENCLTLDNVKDLSLDLVDITHSTMETYSSNLTTTLKSGSSFSSRSSYTSNSDNQEQHKDADENDDEDDNKNDDENDDKDDGQKDKQEDNEEDDANDDDSNSGSSDEEDDEEELKATIKEFPVHVICMEKCDNTLDSLILNEFLPKSGNHHEGAKLLLNDNFEDENEWFAAFTQIIMILITYQKVFSLTHNDLHTNNIMYCETKLKYVYYLYKNKYYKVPTFGRIFQNHRFRKKYL
ncbi:hypothetical protein [Yellowstone lake mimivirus]|uniref:hypothetical protein n=1 Tax=Yellowstone lake mimivirus TaxID=1586712 RepID=UPI0006EBA4E3|nr:hypothetical protein AR680_gp026 [Yellowstone lake mimivirus]BAT21950.1 hypothetical protein [Yellowstone lake mimivirus]